MSRHLLIGCLFLGIGLGGLCIRGSQAQSPTEKAPAKGAEQDRRGPLPFYFGKLGLSDEQKEKMYSVQEDYEKKFEPLREELKKLVRERDGKMENMLSPGQKLRLAELREDAKKKGEKPPEAATDPAF